MTLSSECVAHLQPVAAAFAGFDAPWFFCGGRALDLFMGRTLRARNDVDIGIFRADQPRLFRHFAGRELWYVDPARKEKLPWNGQSLALPVHELYVGSGAEALEVLLNEGDGATWIYRRDPRMTMPLDAALRVSAAGWRYLAPEIVLLYKSKHMRPQDEIDFGFVSSALSPESRHWLDAALAVTAPQHVWRAALHA